LPDILTPSLSLNRIDAYVIRLVMRKRPSESEEWEEREREREKREERRESERCH
jgi:hypothetical protein